MQMKKATEINYSKAIRKLKEGKINYFDELYNSTKKIIFYNIFSYVKDYQISEDLLQETFIKFLDKISEIDENKNPLNYLMVVSKNLSLNWLKKNSRIDELDEISEVNIKSKDDLLEKVYSNDLINIMINILSKEEYNVVYLKVVEEYTHKEISILLDEPIGTITWRYNEAIKKLRKELAYEE